MENKGPRRRSENKSQNRGKQKALDKSNLKAKQIPWKTKGHRNRPEGKSNVERKVP